MGAALQEVDRAEARVIDRQRISGTVSEPPLEVFNNEIGGPPLTLEADDVVTLRFRCRRGIDWSPRWTLEEIRRLIESLDRPIVRGRVRAIYRRGTKVVTGRYTIPIQTVKQAEFVARLRALTNDLTVRPAIPPQVIELE